MTNQPRSSGPDLIGEFQRWLLRSSARGMSREFTDQIKTAFGRGRDAGEVWETATTEPPAEEAPECAWCPVCRAARLLKVSGPGLASQMAAAGDAFGHLLQDAMAVAEATLAAAGRGGGAAKPEQEEKSGPAALRVVKVDVEDAAPGGRPRGADGAQAAESVEGLPRDPDGPDGAQAAESLEGLPREPDDRG